MPGLGKSKDDFVKLLEDGRYANLTNLRRAIGQSKLSDKDKVALTRMGEARFGNSGNGDTTFAAQKRTKRASKKARKRRLGSIKHGDHNGAGDSYAVTCIKSLGGHTPILQVVRVAITAGKTLPELHEDLEAIAGVLPK